MPLTFPSHPSYTLLDSNSSCPHLSNICNRNSERSVGLTSSKLSFSPSPLGEKALGAYTSNSWLTTTVTFWQLLGPHPFSHRAKYSVVSSGRGFEMGFPSPISSPSQPRDVQTSLSPDPPSAESSMSIPSITLSESGLAINTAHHEICNPTRIHR